MTALNEIKYDNRKVNKRKTLFSRLLEVIADMLGIKTVSYTHLDVYKRQMLRMD